MLAITVSKLHYPFGWWMWNGPRVWRLLTFWAPPWWLWRLHIGPRRLIHVLRSVLSPSSPSLSAWCSQARTSRTISLELESAGHWLIPFRGKATYWNPCSQGGDLVMRLRGDAPAGGETAASPPRATTSVRLLNAL